MRASILTPLLAFATAQVAAQDTVQSPEFSLVLLSTNETINGTILVACHEGAGIEGLCLGAGSASPFQFNYSSAATVDPTIGTEGIITYELEGGNFNVSSPLSLSYNPTSNVAVPLFTPGYESTTVSFLNDQLYIPGYIDDTQVPAAVDGLKNYNRWYSCDTYAGYAYTTLAWLMGDGVPENPTCQKVDVVRVFI